MKLTQQQLDKIQRYNDRQHKRKERMRASITAEQSARNVAIQSSRRVTPRTVSIDVPAMMDITEVGAQLCGRLRRYWDAWCASHDILVLCRMYAAMVDSGIAAKSELSKRIAHLIHFEFISIGIYEDALKGSPTATELLQSLNKCNYYALIGDNQYDYRVIALLSAKELQEDIDK